MTSAICLASSSDRQTDLLAELMVPVYDLALLLGVPISLGRDLLRFGKLIGNLHACCNEIDDLLVNSLDLRP